MTDQCWLTHPDHSEWFMGRHRDLSPPTRVHPQTPSALGLLAALLTTMNNNQQSVAKVTHTTPYSVNTHFNVHASLSQVFYCLQEKENPGKSIRPVLKEPPPLQTRRLPAGCQDLQAKILLQTQDVTSVDFTFLRAMSFPSAPTSVPTALYPQGPASCCPTGLASLLLPAGILEHKLHSS